MQLDHTINNEPVLNHTQVSRQDLAIFQAHNVAPQELVVES